MPAKTKRRKAPRADMRSSAAPVRPPERPKMEIVKTLASIPEAAAESATEGFQRRTQIEITICVLLALVTFAVYFRTMQNPFVNYDDQGYVVENRNIQQGLTADFFRWALTSTYATNWHPLTWVSHALDCQLFRDASGHLDASGHHLSSVLLHVLNTVLLFLLLSRATGATFRSVVVAALFGLHPINVESVAWIAERKNVLCMFFILLTLGAYGWYARRPRVIRYLAVVAFFVLALAAKPLAVTLPFMLLLVDFWPLKRVASVGPPSEAFLVPQAQLWRLVLEKVPLLLLSVASSVITMIAQKSAVATNESVSLPVRLVNAVYAYSMYIVKAFWPVHLSAFYPYQGYRVPGWGVLLGVLFLAGTTVWVWRERTRVYLPVGWCWFMGTLVPMIGLVQVGDQAMADRYAYLSLIGIFVMLVWGVADLVESRQLNPRLWAAAAAVVVAMSVVTWRQIGFWHSSHELWFHALAVTKDNYMAEDYAGSSLLLDAYQATGQRRLDEAAVHFRNAVRINPNDASSHLNLGADMHERGQFREAIEQYQIVLRLTRDEHLVTKCLIDLGAASQQLGDYAAAKQYYRQARELEPNNEVIFLNMGKVGMLERVQELAAAAAAKPSPQAYLELGQLQQAAGLVPEARQSFQTAIKLKPKFAEAQQALDSLGAGANQ